MERVHQRHNTFLTTVHTLRPCLSALPPLQSSPGLRLGLRPFPDNTQILHLKTHILYHQCRPSTLRHQYHRYHCIPHPPCPGLETTLAVARRCPYRSARTTLAPWITHLRRALMLALQSRPRPAGFMWSILAPGLAVLLRPTPIQCIMDIRQTERIALYLIHPLPPNPHHLRNVPQVTPVQHLMLVRSGGRNVSLRYHLVCLSTNMTLT